MSEALIQKSRAWFTPAGLLLMLWSTVVTAVDIQRYGIEWGMYWWFCNLALFGMGVGLLIRSRAVIVGWLSIAIFTQTFWLADNLLQLFTGRNTLGLVHYLYQPGLPMDEFLLSHYHYFTIPVGLLALCYLPRKGLRPYPLIAFFNPFIFAVSYFCFPANQNINCIHEACVQSFEHLSGPAYSLSFWAFTFVLNLVLANPIDRFFNPEIWSVRIRSIVSVCLKGAVMAGIGLTILDTSYKLSLPSLNCLDAKTEGDVDVACRYTRYQSPSELVLAYRATNHSVFRTVCTTTIAFDGVETPLNDSIVIEGQSSLDLSTVVPSPSSDTLLSFKSSCKEQMTN
ncbi:MAG: hypothetical protein HY537_08955 [Deltaproteobacteria bacterium]|nr:hypothetical protein [Deltaproteobacteria bacterium]